MRRWRIGAAALVAAVTLASCTGFGAVDQRELEEEAQGRGGGVTQSLITEGLDEVAAASGRDPLTVLGITASLGQVTVVIPSADGTAAETWRYGTSGLLGGKGLFGPERSGAASGTPFTAEAAGVDGLDAAIAAARASVGRPDAWVESVAIRQASTDAAPLTSVLLVDADGQQAVVLDAQGQLVGEGPR